MNLHGKIGIARTINKTADKGNKILLCSTENFPHLVQMVSFFSDFGLGLLFTKNLPNTFKSAGTKVVAVNMVKTITTMPAIPMERIICKGGKNKAIKDKTTIIPLNTTVFPAVFT